MSGIHLTEKQKQAIEFAREGKCFFLSGPAGTGKSFIINHISSFCPGIKITASTGIAAETIGGTTLHSFAGVGLAKDPMQKLVQNIRNNQLTMSRWLSTKILIIDEISMISSEFLDLIDEIAKEIRKNKKPFGGMQVICVGDFYQLPPVQGDFAFEADVWPELIGLNVVVLEEVFRQKDPKFLKALHEIRTGKLTSESYKYITENSGKITDTHGILPTKLYSKNSEVDEINEKQLAALPGESYEYTAFDTVVPKFSKSVINFPISDLLELKVDAQVIILKNSDDYKNGTRARVVECLDETVRVETLDGVFTLKYEQFDVYSGKIKIATRRMIPLKLAWALTIHRSQGLTIDLLEVDLESVFAPAQAYTALSRARTVEGLKVKGLSERVVYCNEKVSKYYKSLQEAQSAHQPETEPPASPSD